MKYGRKEDRDSIYRQVEAMYYKGYSNEEIIRTFPDLARLWYSIFSEENRLKKKGENRSPTWALIYSSISRIKHSHLWNKT